MVEQIFHPHQGVGLVEIFVSEVEPQGPAVGNLLHPSSFGNSMKFHAEQCSIFIYI